LLIHEFQARRLLFEEGIDSPRGRVAESPGEAETAFLDLAPPAAYVKGQRVGPGRSASGLVAKAEHAHEIREAAAKMLGKWDGPSSRSEDAVYVDRVLVVEEAPVSREVHVRARVERSSGEVLVEVLGAEAEPAAGPAAVEAYVPLEGLRPFQARKLAAAAEVGPEHGPEFCRVLVALSRAVARLDAESVELHPLALTEDGRALVLDPKVTIDDRAAFRHAEIRRFSDGVEEDMRVLRAKRSGLRFVPLEGDVACVATEADLAAAAADAVTVAGGEPAFLLELGGAVGPTQVAEASRMLAGETALKSVLVWIYGLDLSAVSSANALRAAIEGLSVELPVAVYVSGPGRNEGLEFLSEAPAGPEFCGTLSEAARFTARPMESPQ